MALLITKEDNPELFDTFSYSSFCKEEDSYFILTNTSNPEDHIHIPFPFKFDTIPCGYSVTVYCFKNKHFAQRDLIELRARERETQNGRIGYIFSIGSITDSENANFNAHSIPFVYYAIKKLISQSAENFQSKPLTKRKDNYTLIDFYRDDLILVVLCDQLTAEIINFSFDDYLFFLYNYGFIYANDKEEEITYNDLEFIKERYQSIKQNQNKGKFVLEVNAAPKFLRDEIYPDNLIKILISENHFFLAKFLILYQVIELLMDRVLKNELSIKICYEQNTLTGYKIKEKLRLLSTDGYKIKRLLGSDYSSVDASFYTSFSDEIQNLFQFLKLDNDDTGDNQESKNLPSILYKYRNNLVHNYRKIHKSDHEYEKFLTIVRNINFYMEYLVCELLHSFKK